MKVCSGGPPGQWVCGRKWYETQDDGTRDVGNQMTEMILVQSNLIQKVAAPADRMTGLSTGDAGAGNGNHKLSPEDILITRPLTTTDRVGGWLITSIALGAAIYWAWFLLADEIDLEDWIYSAYFYRGGGYSHQEWYGR